MLHVAVHELSHQSRASTICFAIAEVFNILAPPTVLFQPRVLFRVLALMLKPARQRKEPVERKHISSQILHHVQARD